MTEKTRTTIPLRQSLLVRVGVLVTGAVLLAGLVFFHFGMEPLVRRIAESQFTQAASEVESNLDNVFLPAEHILKMSHNWIGLEPPPLEDPTIFNRIFKPVLETLPHATSVVAGTSTGEGWMLMQRPEGGWRNRMTDIERWEDKHLFFEWDESGEITAFRKPLDYDPRQRSWYQTASGKTDKVHWTAPYTFFTTGDPGITGTTGFNLPDGRTFAIGIDLMLRDLSLTTMDARLGQNGMALVLTEDQRVLALPAPPAGTSREEWLHKALSPVDALNILPLSTALQHYPTDKNETIHSFSADGATWLVRKHSYRLGEHTLRVVTLAPAADFAPDWLPILLPLAAALLLLLWIVAAFASHQARRVALPLEKLTEVSEKIGQLDFAHSTMTKTKISEIEKLAAAQEKMRDTLLRHQQQISSQEARLRSQIEALSEAEKRIRESEAYNKVLYTDSRIPLLVLDPETERFIDCNPAAAEILGLPGAQAVIGLTTADISPPCQYDGSPSGQAAGSVIRKALEEGATVREWHHRRPDGSEWDSEIHLMPFTHADRRLIQCSIQDITQRKQSVQALQQLAMFDTLTGLYNRSLFIGHLRQALVDACDSGQAVAVLYLDLDRFKEINDTQGHTFGDDVLREVARRFSGVLREEEILARLGGDEFAVLARHVDPATTNLIAERIIGTLSTRISIGNQAFALGVSIGIATFPCDGETPDALLRNADIAMYCAKTGGHGYMRYTPEMSSGIAESINLARDLKEALHLRPEELTLFYQPLFDLKTGVLLGAEALMRWTHPQQGPVSPAVFISVAESRGMMPLIGNWVVQEACRQIRAWRDEGLSLPGRLALNIAAQQLEDKTFPAQVTGIVRAHGLDPTFFELELTESGMMKNVGQSVELFNELNEAGFSLAIDDFGTGYSSLAYLKQLPAGKLKIDQSFVREMADYGNDHTIVSTIIAMGKTLGMRTIAEGVETPVQAEVLLALGCDEAQGYLFGRPESASVFAAKWLHGAIPQTQHSQA